MPADDATPEVRYRDAWHMFDASLITYFPRPDDGVAASAPAAAPPGERYKVVLQVSDSDVQKWNMTLNNARNIQTDLGAGNVDVEVVTFGPGIAMLKKGSEVASRVDAVESIGRMVRAYRERI